MTREHTDDAHDARRTLGEISHTDPHTGSAFGDTMTFERGRTVAADGGERDPRSSSDDRSFDGDERDAGAPEDDEEPTADADDPLREIDHTPPAEADGANNVYQRGHEGREEDA